MHTVLCRILTCAFPGRVERIIARLSKALIHTSLNGPEILSTFLSEQLFNTSEKRAEHSRPMFIFGGFWWLVATRQKSPPLTHVELSPGQRAVVEEAACSSQGFFFRCFSLPRTGPSLPFNLSGRGPVSFQASCAY